MPTTDDIGSRGEAIFRLRVTQPCGEGKTPLFRPHFLGDKFESLDFLVELIGTIGQAAFFFVQVKTTTQGLTKRLPGRLKVSVSRRDVQRMLAYPAPTYLIGIDLDDEQAYLASVNRSGRGQVASLNTEHPLNPSTLRSLWNEVHGFWASRDLTFENSVFEV